MVETRPSGPNALQRAPEALLLCHVFAPKTRMLQPLSSKDVVGAAHWKPLLSPECSAKTGLCVTCWLLCETQGATAMPTGCMTAHGIIKSSAAALSSAMWRSLSTQHSFEAEVSLQWPQGPSRRPSRSGSRCGGPPRADPVLRDSQGALDN